ncbi:MAG: hypothetical protein ACKPAC_10375 [Alphaproteobacteria bacterium]
MVKLILFVMLLCPLSVNAGTWERINQNAIRFSGHIQRGDFESLQAILSADDRILYLDSKGGDVEVGVRLASHLLPRQLTVIVDGICASSCANYLFTSGLNKEIRRGWVGFHGNATALMAQDWYEVARKFKEEGGLSDQQISELHARFMALAEIEQKYLERAGVDQALFERTQKPDKGVGDGVPYHFLLPRPETFERYGIRNVVGHQDLSWGAELNLNKLHD